MLTGDSLEQKLEPKTDFSLKKEKTFTALIWKEITYFFMY